MYFFYFYSAFFPDRKFLSLFFFIIFIVFMCKSYSESVMLPQVENHFLDAPKCIKLNLCALFFCGFLVCFSAVSFVIGCSEELHFCHSDICGSCLFPNTSHHIICHFFCVACRVESFLYSPPQTISRSESASSFIGFFQGGNTELSLLSGGRAARKLFALNKTGGISVLLHSIEHNVADTSYVELALSLLCSLTNAASVWVLILSGWSCILEKPRYQCTESCICLDSSIPDQAASAETIMSWDKPKISNWRNYNITPLEYRDLGCRDLGCYVKGMSANHTHNSSIVVKKNRQVNRPRIPGARYWILLKHYEKNSIFFMMLPCVIHWRGEHKNFSKSEKSRHNWSVQPNIWS